MNQRLHITRTGATYLCGAAISRDSGRPTGRGEQVTCHKCAEKAAHVLGQFKVVRESGCGGYSERVVRN
jgi:hypothetical protein